MTEDHASTTGEGKDAINEIDGLTQELFATKSDIQVLELRVDELERKIARLQLARSVRQRQSAPSIPRPGLDVPRVAPLISPRAPLSRDSFLSDDERSEPPAFRRIKPSASATGLSPLPAISSEHRLRELRRAKRPGRRVDATWQEVALVAVPALVVMSLVIGGVKWFQSDDTSSQFPIAAAEATPDSSATALQPSVLTQSVSTPSRVIGSSPTVQDRSPTASVAPRATDTATAVRETDVPLTPSSATSVASPSAVTSATPSTAETNSKPTQTSQATDTPASADGTRTSDAPTNGETPTEEDEPTESPTATSPPVSPVPGGVGSTSDDVEQTFGPVESVNSAGQSAFQDSTVLVRFTPTGRVWQVTFELAVDELVFDRDAADDLAAFYRPPDAQLLKSESIGTGLERLTYATPGLAAFLAGEDIKGHDTGVYIEEFHFDPNTGRVQEIVTQIGESP